MERMWSSVLGRWTQGYAIGAAVYQWCEFKCRRGTNTNLTSKKNYKRLKWFVKQHQIHKTM